MPEAGVRSVSAMLWSSWSFAACTAEHAKSPRVADFQLAAADRSR